MNTETAPGGCRPLDQANLLEPQARLYRLPVDIQVSIADIQDPPHVDTCLSQPSHHSVYLWLHSALLYNNNNNNHDDNTYSTAIIAEPL